MQDKTNVMRILDSKKIWYKPYCYKDTNAISGMEVVNVLNEDPNQVFKTLVTRSGSGVYYVFIVPVNKFVSCNTIYFYVGYSYLYQKLF